MPKVSIIMNCYNGERYLREAIDSIVRQAFTDWELVFWDNASTDNSPEIVKSYLDPRVRYFRGERNVPLGEARKFAMERVSGEWIGFLDTDDLWYPQKLERQIAALSGTDHVMCFSGIDEIMPDGALIRTIRPLYATGWMFEQQLMQYDINMVSPLIRRQVLEERGLTFNPEVTASEEYNLFLRVIVHGSVAAIEEPLAAMRIGTGTLTDRQMHRWADERLLTLRQLEQENPGITKKYSRAFAVAGARGEYYRSRYYMSQGKSAEARKALRKVFAIDVAYRAMFCLTFSRMLWQWAHSTTLKRKWLPRLWSLVAPK